MDGKKPWKSWTIIVNAITLLGSLATYFWGIDPGLVGLIALGATGVVNIGLRIVTSQPINWGKVVEAAPDLIQDVVNKDVAGIAENLTKMSDASEMVEVVEPK